MLYRMTIGNGNWAAPDCSTDVFFSILRKKAAAILLYADGLSKQGDWNLTGRFVWSMF